MITPTERFDVEDGFEVSVQVPEPHAPALRAAITRADPLRYGPYDNVSFQSHVGVQHFRALAGGRNAPTAEVVAVACVDLQVFVTSRKALDAVVAAIYAQHPYEEPVVILRRASRTRHRPGLDENNPNKFWNNAAEDWVPEEHRG